MGVRYIFQFQWRAYVGGGAKDRAFLWGIDKSPQRMAKIAPDRRDLRQERQAQDAQERQEQKKARSRKVVFKLFSLPSTDSRLCHARATISSRLSPVGA